MCLISLVNKEGKIGKWMDSAILRPFQQYFSHIRTMVGDNERLCAVEPHSGLKRFPPQAGPELGTTESAGKRLTH